MHLDFSYFIVCLTKQLLHPYMTCQLARKTGLFILYKQLGCCSSGFPTHHRNRELIRFHSSLVVFQVLTGRQLHASEIIMR